MNRSSLAARIVVVVIGIDLVFLALLVALGMYAARSELRTAFDAGLQSKAMSIRALVRYDEGGSSDLLFDTTGLPPSADPAHPDVFAVYLKGALFAASAGWTGLPAATRYPNGEFARFDQNGIPYRGFIIHEIEILDREDDPSAPVAKISVVYGSSLLEMRHRVLRVGFYLGGIGLLLLLPTSWLTVWAVRRGLHPLHDLAARAGEISVRSWSFEPTAAASAAPELAPLTGALQTLLARLHASFATQRQFTEDLAHELKTSVAIIKSGAQVLLHNPRSAEEYRAGVASLVTDCERLESLVERMLRLARAEQLAEHGARQKLGAANLRATCEAAVSRVAALADAKHIRIELTGRDHATVHADADDLELVWTNLLDNAVRHSPAGATVSVRLSREDGAGAGIAIEDSGEGISADELPHIFERFRRGENTNGGGTHGFGLGLAICKAIVEAYGGRISIDSAARRGTRVLVYFPSPPSS
jgi:signal transduction histidine kinase